MRRTFDDLEKSVLRLLAKGWAKTPREGLPDAALESPAQVPGKSEAKREAAELVRRAIKRLKSV